MAPAWPPAAGAKMMDKADRDSIRLMTSVKAALDGLKSLDQRNPAVVMIMNYLLTGIRHIGTDNEVAIKWLNLALWCLRADGPLGQGSRPQGG